MRQDKVLRAILTAVQQSPEFDGGSFSIEELDLDDGDARVEQPYVELKIISDTRENQFDTDRVGFITDGSGRRTGRIFEETRDASLEAHIVYASGNDNFDTYSLGEDFSTALHPFDSNVDNPLDFPDPDGGTVDDIDHFEVLDGSPDSELGGVGVRKYRQELRVEYRRELFRSDDRTVEKVVVSDSGEANQAPIEFTVQ